MKINRQTLLFVSAIAVVVVLGLVFAGREKRSESLPPLKVESQTVFETIVSNEGGVEVAVTPVNLFDSSKWAFEISLTTHSVELSEDMLEVSKLVLDLGETLIPTGWEGDPPGGHHRSGVLVFEEDFSLPEVALKIFGVGGVPEREFKWK